MSYTVTVRSENALIAPSDIERLYLSCRVRATPCKCIDNNGFVIFDFDGEVEKCLPRALWFSTDPALYKSPTPALLKAALECFDSVVDFTSYVGISRTTAYNQLQGKPPMEFRAWILIRLMLGEKLSLTGIPPVRLPFNF